ncbi:MAG: SDR family NAD(P)-dependent oxidoreductase [Chloroflexota bacterium]
MKSKWAMIWGANGDIGQAVVKHLKESGWSTCAVSRSIDNVESMADVSASIRDIGDSASVDRAVLEVGYEADPLDLWVYSIGDISLNPVQEMDYEIWNRMILANLTGAYLAVKASLPLMSEKAHIVFIGAVNERLRLPGLSAYAAAKAGLEAFAEALKKEERKKKVTVVRPGAVDTSFWEKVPLKKPKDAMAPEKVAQKIVEIVENGTKGTVDLTH